jgi:hypothetical protein
MAKNKHTINDIQKALLSSTRYIKDDDMQSNEKVASTTPVINDENQVNIDPLSMKKLRILAPYLGETPDELVNKALSHFLRLKSLQLDQAIQKLTEE